MGLHFALSPVLLGRGEAMFQGLDLPALSHRVTESTATDLATHVVLGREEAKKRPLLQVRRRIAVGQQPPTSAGSRSQPNDCFREAAQLRLDDHSGRQSALASASSMSASTQTRRCSIPRISATGKMMPPLVRIMASYLLLRLVRLGFRLGQSDSFRRTFSQTRVSGLGTPTYPSSSGSMHWPLRLQRSAGMDQIPR